jgi:hypothetical protein
MDEETVENSAISLLFDLTTAVELLSRMNPLAVLPSGDSLSVGIQASDAARALPVRCIGSPRPSAWSLLWPRAKYLRAGSLFDLSF